MRSQNGNYQRLRSAVQVDAASLDEAALVALATEIAQCELSSIP
jgi:hypothetical protein